MIQTYREFELRICYSVPILIIQIANFIYKNNVDKGTICHDQN